MVLGRARDRLTLGATSLLLGGALTACTPAHRAKREPEAPPTPAAPRTSARPDAAQLLATRTGTTAIAAKPAVEAWAPARLDMATLRKERLQGGTARVSMELARQYGATQRTVSVEVCVGVDGSVVAPRTKQVDGPFDVGELVRTSILQWRFQPRKTPACAVFNFVLQRDGYCREEG